MIHDEDPLLYLIKTVLLTYTASLNEFLGCVDKVDKWKLMHRKRLTALVLSRLFLFMGSNCTCIGAEMTDWVNDASNLVFL